MNNFTAIQTELTNLILSELDPVSKYYCRFVCKSFYKQIEDISSKEILYWKVLERTRKCGGGFGHICGLFSPCKTNNYIVNINNLYYKPIVVPIKFICDNSKDENMNPILIIKPGYYLNLNWGSGYTLGMDYINIKQKIIYFLANNKWNKVTGEGAIHYGFLTINKDML